MDPKPRPETRRLPWPDAIFLALALVLLAAIGTGLAWTFLADDGAEVATPLPPTATPAGSPPFTRPSTPAAGGTCGSAQTVRPFESAPGDRAHADVPLSRYPSVPPASGPHASATLPAGFYEEPPPMGPVIHSLEHGAVVIWFEPSLAESAALREIREFMGPSGPGQGLHIIIAPFDYAAEGEAGRLPSGVAVAMVAWHRLMYCTRLGADTLPAAANFVVSFRCHPGCDMTDYMGDAPEAGVQI